MLKPKTLLARRRLIVTIILLAALVTVGYLNSRETTIAQVSSDEAIVAISKAEGSVPNDSQIEAAVREAIDLAGGLPDNVGPGKKIVIQPNLVETGFASGSGVVTDVRVIRAIINMCLEAGATVDNITICEGSAGFRGGDQGGYPVRAMTLKAFRDAGYDTNGDMLEDITGAKIVDANYVKEDYYASVYGDYPYESESKYNLGRVTKIDKPGKLINRSYYVPKCVAECDVLIRVPCLKNHDTAGLTAGLKLAFGFAPVDIYHYGGLSLYKWNLLHKHDVSSWGTSDELVINSKGMADMTYVRPPDLVVVDGLVGVMSGPNREPLDIPDPKMKCIIAGYDVVAVDSICALVIGYRLDTIPGITQAASLGLGTNDLGKITVVGEHVKDVRRWFPHWAKTPGTNNLNPNCGVPGDSNPPVVSSLNVVEGSHVSGSLYVRPTSFSDNNPGVAKAELYVDGVLVDKSAIAGTSFATTWNIGSNVSEGQHTITYIMYDKMYNETTLTRNVYVHSGDQITGALNVPDGTSVNVGPVYAAGRAAAIDNKTFFVVTPDGLHGLRVSYSTTAPNFPLGYELNLTGTMTTVNGQRVLNISSYPSGVTKTLPAPRLFRNSALGGKSLGTYAMGATNGGGPFNVGCVVRVAGKVSAGGSDYFYIDDGSMKLKVLSGSLAQPVPGQHVSLTGFSCIDNGERLFVLRYANDIKTYN